MSGSIPWKSIFLLYKGSSAAAWHNDVRVLPILVGELDDGDAKKAARKLADATARYNPLFIISSDFTHYGPNFGYEPFRNSGGQSNALKLKELDGGAIDLILKKDMAGFSGYCDKTGATICGQEPDKYRPGPAHCRLQGGKNRL